MTNNVIVIRSYSHSEMIDSVSLMFANNESDLTDIQLRMAHTERKSKTYALDLYQTDREYPIAKTYNHGFSFILRYLRSMYKNADTSVGFMNAVNLLTSPCRTSYLERTIK